jgi:hypothetical protein
LAAVVAGATAAWNAAVEQASQTYDAALSAAQAAWTEAEAAAWSQSTAATQTAFAAYRDILEDLQAQADAAWDDYQRTLQAAGCAPAPGPAPEFVQFAGDTLPKPPSWWDWISEWFWNTTSSVGAPPTITWLEGLPGIVKTAIIREMEKRIARMEHIYDPNSKEEVYAARELEALKAGNGALSRFYKDNPLPPRRPGFPPFVPAYQDPNVTRHAQPPRSRRMSVKVSSCKPMSPYSHP